MSRKPVALATGVTSHTKQDQSNSIPTKHELCLLELLEAGLHGICQLTALGAYGDTCLNTTISELGLQRGLLISRKPRPYTHRSGGKTHFHWYWFATRNEAAKGLKRLNEFRTVRKQPSIDSITADLLLSQYPSSNLDTVA